MDEIVRAERILNRDPMRASTGWKVEVEMALGRVFWVELDPSGQFLDVRLMEHKK